MQWSLFVLILMGQCCFFMCQLYEYHFIDEDKSWKDAQTYCKEKYTDLATVYDMTDMERLLNSTETRVEAWTGLYKNPGRENRMWHWSLPGLEYNDSERQWANDKPNDHRPEICVSINHDKLWSNDYCNGDHEFICYDEKKSPNGPYFVIAKGKTWSQAQKYCRENHTDLISGLTQLNEVNVSNPAKRIFWIGLFSDTWGWSDGSTSSFRNWDSEVGDKNCTLLKSSGQWKSADCGQTKPFFCYKEYMILINKNKTWEEALYYCRKYYYDLISITNVSEQRWVQEKAKNASSPYVWTGLRYTCTLEFWFWVSDEEVQYTNWMEREDECNMSGAMERGGEHRWYSHPASERFNFICSTY